MSKGDAPVRGGRAQIAQLDTHLNVLFEAPVVVVTAAPTAGCGLLAAESSTVARAVERRRNEYATVRACARKALEVLGHPDPMQTAIPSGTHREPLWPDGYVGSLSHSRELCCAVVGRRSSALSLGIDVEPDVDILSSLVGTICSPAEIEDASRLLGMAPIEFTLLAFSGKESFYKAYFPLTRQFLDFTDVSLSLRAGDDRHGIFSVALRSGLPMSGREDRFVGKWVKHGHNLFTGVTHL